MFCLGIMLHEDVTFRNVEIFPLPLSSMLMKQLHVRVSFLKPINSLDLNLAMVHSREARSRACFEPTFKPLLKR
jgi:hypothetical protein